jgi:hypothetical protein
MTTDERRGGGWRHFYSARMKGESPSRRVGPHSRRSPIRFARRTGKKKPLNNPVRFALLRGTQVLQKKVFDTSSFFGCYGKIKNAALECRKQ